MKVEKSKNGGITLIALVITIIVLLVLAGVSIATLTGENGILTRAGDAKTNTEIAEEKEAIGLAYNGVMAENRGNGVSSGELKAELISNGYDVTASGSNPITVKFKDSQRVYTVDSNGNIELSDGNDDNDGTTLVDMFIAGESCENPDNCDNEEHLHVGDYLKYTPSDSTASTADMEDNPLKSQYTGVEDIQTYTVNSNTKWQVIGLSEDRQHVLLTTESPIQRDGADPYLKLGGAESYIYCKKVLDGVCSIYANDDLADEVRSMTMEDITNVLGITIDKEENNEFIFDGDDMFENDEGDFFWDVDVNEDLSLDSEDCGTKIIEIQTQKYETYWKEDYQNKPEENNLLILTHIENNNVKVGNINLNELPEDKKEKIIKELKDVLK